MSDDGSDSSSDAEGKEGANAAMAGYSMMMPQLSQKVGGLGGLVPDGSGIFDVGIWLKIELPLKLG